MISLQDFVRKHNLVMTLTTADHNPNMADDTWARTATHWIARLHHGKKQMAVPFSQGSAHTVPPTITDVLDALAIDSAGHDDHRGFQDWAEEYGYDIDSRKAERIFNAVIRQAKALLKFLGPAAYDELLYKTERE